MKHRLLSSLAVTVVAASISPAVARQAEASETTARAWAAARQSAIAQAQQSAPEPTFLLANAAVDSAEAEASPSNQQTARSTSASATLANLYRHEQDGKLAATLFVRGLPVLTFLGEEAASKAAAASNWQPGFLDAASVQAGEIAGVSDADSDPVQRAAAVASRLNAIDFSDFDATTIDAAWDADREAYVIEAGDKAIAVVDRQAQLADSTNNWEQDVLQATNRLRRLLGNAERLAMSDIETRPAARRVAYAPAAAAGPGRFLQSGMASWYGPGFHGRRSASGERFNQNAMTAAHRTLPFGTQVRVTNINNGRSAIVRINDRGPFTGGRVIDLSRAAASAIGMLGSGVAPVRVEVLGR